MVLFYLLKERLCLGLELRIIFSTDPRQTKVYLFATDSTFVPSMYCTFNDTNLRHEAVG